MKKIKEWLLKFAVKGTQDNLAYIIKLLIETYVNSVDGVKVVISDDYKTVDILCNGFVVKLQSLEKYILCCIETKGVKNTTEVSQDLAHSQYVKLKAIIEDLIQKSGHKRDYLLTSKI
ncbi:hypothetical protein [Francisella tularensis]|uniref:hypothetical protein n=1 Tax=Francisella tularensis TaxID=263 RepID=UPI0008F533A1|nr:hypothetical protein [Francisella tularensis]APA83218.1 hypothetical protein N894_1234 [Francisella tularensis subsp. novicida PA10-7858]